MTLTGQQIRRAMRAYRVTILDVARHMSITQKRVRQVRAAGVCGRVYVLDWVEGISGAGRAKELTNGLSTAAA
jgi:hypothetical protein